MLILYLFSVMCSFFVATIYVVLLRNLDPKVYGIRKIPKGIAFLFFIASIIPIFNMLFVLFGVSQIFQIFFFDYKGTGLSNWLDDPFFDMAQQEQEEEEEEVPEHIDEEV